MRSRSVVAAIAGAVAGYIHLARRRQLSWGATDQESNEPLAGDDVIAHADLTATRAITISASAAQIWPWIAQLGQGRGGFYSYDFLENLARCDIHSADRIVLEWQDVGVGDEVRLAPEAGLVVACLERGRSLVLWAFALRPEPDGTTRLLVRERYAYRRPWARLLVEPVEVVSFVMSRKMLRGIKHRAERIAALTVEPSRPPNRS